ncbi:hypothetical protein [Fuchsiella alkaliacetigena]|uniref:hypothetical protein n=1 Tax=Fuchsiella alkaliacetigena TaxID=957042 RepID=UPI00200B62AF|nr:hypothetical protein [Fuchsiella alkaliacetigena]MCK8825368.1 hypothetical protein [Fuchsiella alkaliacetigena]
MGLKNKYVVAQSQKFKFSNIKEKIEEIAHHFATYLDDFWGKSSSNSKHATMGPVGKVLEKVKTAEWGKDDLLGYTIRVHEMNSDKGYLSDEALEGLEQGITEVLKLVDDIPLQAKSKAIEHIGYAVYYKQRKKDFEYYEQVKQEFVSFLKEKYGTEEEVSESWKEEVSFDDIRYPSKSQLQDACGQRKEDIKKFREDLK